jgi:ferredoxin-NADP reductase
VHGARDAAHHSLSEEVRAVAAAHTNITLHFRYSRPGIADARGDDYDSKGRLDIELLEKLLPGLDANFYLCGPAAFLADLQRDLRSAGIEASQIHTEAF